jgi:ankyrin repeat protein
VERGHAETVQLLLQAGADLAAVDADGLTPLSYAVLHPRCEGTFAPGLLGMLFAAGASVSEVKVCDRDGRNALHIAASDSCSSVCLRAFVSAGIDMNAANQYGWTPLHCAVNCDEASTVTDLLSLGAAADVPDPRGKTALSMAVRRAAKFSPWSTDHPWVLTFKAFMKHHRTAPFSAAALVAAAAVGVSQAI